MSKEMIRLFVFFLLAGEATSAVPASEASTDAVLAEVVGLAKEQALNGAMPDWTSVEREARLIFEAKQGEDGRTAAVRHVLAALKDGHSSYRPPAVPGQSRVSPRAAQAQVRREIAEAHPDAAGAGRLVINSWVGSNEAMLDAARTVRSELNKAMVGSGCALILDISSNSGGNMWPMMGGIAPLYDEGVLETFADREGNLQVVNVRGGMLRMNESVFPRADLDPLTRKPVHIAVLLGSRTASSGEILALGFKGQKNVRFFGQPTAGATTSNRTLRLSNGGQLALTTARILDRSGAVHHGRVQPDVVSNHALAAAREWVASQCQ